MLMPGLARARLALARHGRVVAAALLCLAILAFGVAAVSLPHPPTTTVTDRDNHQSVAGGVDTAAIVASNTTLYEAGERLEGKPVYLLRSAPRLSLEAEADVPENQSVIVDQRLELAYRATRGGEAFWNRTRTLASHNESVRDGNATLSTVLDVEAVQQRKARIQREIGGAGSVSVSLRYRIAYETESYRGTLSDSAPLRVGADSYALKGTLAVDREHSTTRRRDVPDPSRTVAVAGTELARNGVAYAGAGVCLLLGAVAVVAGRRRGVDEEALERRLERQRYAEWISVGRVPPDAAARVVTIASLPDLVDLAIDANRRVVHDESREEYVVLDGETLYRYSESEPPTAEWKWQDRPDDR